MWRRNEEAADGRSFSAIGTLGKNFLHDTENRVRRRAGAQSFIDEPFSQDGRCPVLAHGREEETKRLFGRIRSVTNSRDAAGRCVLASNLTLVQTLDPWAFQSLKSNGSMMDVGRTLPALSPYHLQRLPDFSM